jgi:hypothetical protein
MAAETPDSILALKNPCARVRVIVERTLDLIALNDRASRFEFADQLCP